MKHTLKYDGAPHGTGGDLLSDLPEKGKPSTAGEGRAACSCGWVSENLNSRAARIMAHRVHKVAPGSTETTVTYSQGNKSFTKVMLEGGALLAVSRGCAAGEDIRERSLILSGPGSDEVALAVTALWEDAYAAFKEWKKADKERRREWHKTKDPAMRREELAWFKAFFEEKI